MLVVHLIYPFHPRRRMINECVARLQQHGKASTDARRVVPSLTLTPSTNAATRAVSPGPGETLQMLCQSVAGDGFTCSSFVCRLRWCDSCRHGHCRWAPAEPSARAAPPTPESPGTPVEDAQVYGRRSRREAGQSHLSAGGTSERCWARAPATSTHFWGLVAVDVDSSCTTLR